MTLNSSSRDNNSFRSQDSSLEFLNDTGVEVVDIRAVSMNRISKRFSSVSSLVDIILENFISSEESLKFMSIGVFIHTNAGWDKIFGLQGAISDQREDVDHIVSKTVCSIVAIFSGVLHLKLASRHLDYTVVDCFTGVNSGFKVSIFQGQHGSASFGSLISSAHIHE